MMPDERHLADASARQLALTALDRTLLVEAGAGSGKTSVLAGRVTSLLAAGRRPDSIAAVTFTELAAAELRERVGAFVEEVAAGKVRPDLHAAFPHGPSPEQQAALRQACESLDELTCTTIHGFCQVLLTPYPVEAGMDPGAAIMDRAAADEMFAGILDAWLRERLSGTGRPDGLVATLYLDAPGPTGKLLTTLALKLLAHRDAGVAEVQADPDPLLPLRRATSAFRSFLAGAECRELETVELVEQLEALVGGTPATDTPECETLLHLRHLAAPKACRNRDGGYAAYQKKGKWKAAAKGSCSAAAADVLNERATACYADCRDAHDAAKAYAAGRILHALAGELRGVLQRFAEAKRAAALVDFDDLLVKARDLLLGQPAVRSALGRRFGAVLVDEFQDTDPLQCEILWRLCGEPPAGQEEAAWPEWELRPGALFVVGDPKQAIYRFRGADVESYVLAREVLQRADPNSRLVIGQNFRSVGEILRWVNGRFGGLLSHPSQPGFEELFTVIEAEPGRMAVATLPVTVAGAGSAAEIRDAEADAVAELCERIIGALTVRGREGERACRPDDIALLAPGGAELWRYERALEERGVSVSTQAGKGFYRRQEVQDLIALTRVLADGRDTLALGALLRGPLVGLTEEQLLDATDRLPEAAAGARLSLWTPITDVDDVLLRTTLEILQVLAKRARSTTPFILLCQAVEELQVRAILRQRRDRTAERALSNVDLFLEQARAFDVRGLKAFASAMRTQWEKAQRALEGRPDTEQQSVSLVTMHSSKGLEWPVVIPVNTGSRVMSSVDSALDRASALLHMPVFGHYPPGTREALDAEREALERERHRIWYVAATRARDLLLLPHLSCAIPKSSWMAAFPLDHDSLPAFLAEGLGPSRLHRTEERANDQDRALFETEAALIATRTRRLQRLTPHLAEADEVVERLQGVLVAADGADGAPNPPRGSLARGLILHKLLEEVLTGETPDDLAALERRAALLAAQLHGTPGAAGFDAAEAAHSVRRGLAVPQICEVRSTLLPEMWVGASVQSGPTQVVTSGIVDAMATGPGGTTSLVVDWKSDVAPTPATVARYCGQVRAYLSATGTARGLLVFLTTGMVEIIEA